MLKQRMPSSRNRFTGADLDFLTSVLAPDEQRMHLEKLWNDADALREILDLKEVFRGLLDSPAAIQVSPRFYFYVLVRHAFLDADLCDAELADYVAGVMAKRISPSPDDPLQNIARGYTHASDFIAILSHAKGRMRFHLQMAAGNQFLILTGLYPSFLKHRCQQYGAPELEFYEEFAQSSFREAAHNRMAPGQSSRRVLGTLSEAMPTVRRSLNRLAEEFVFLG
ncbi:hypothetical protein JIN84_13490 [Luteolibacter yonseiensis]|uniref:Uncharacterized protein n=1 Tax=Luteolibacter yonseiensis TaxID=1144680 RepID=A0A934R1G1_9BACT|nr:hypothetical protein [Luteolibacter yonseiensis]MBK1816633.1 hypothetical protein [Luteolibacter yonseiensis]